MFPPIVAGDGGGGVHSWGRAICGVLNLATTAAFPKKINTIDKKKLSWYLLTGFIRPRLAYRIHKRAHRTRTLIINEYQPSNTRGRHKKHNMFDVQYWRVHTRPSSAWWRPPRAATGGYHIHKKHFDFSAAGTYMEEKQRQPPRPPPCRVQIPVSPPCYRLPGPPNSGPPFSTLLPRPRPPGPPPAVAAPRGPPRRRAGKGGGGAGACRGSGNPFGAPCRRWCRPIPVVAVPRSARPAVHKSREEEWDGMRRGGLTRFQLQWKSCRFPSERESKSDTRLVVQESV